MVGGSNPAADTLVGNEVGTAPATPNLSADGNMEVSASETGSGNLGSALGEGNTAKEERDKSV